MDLSPVSLQFLRWARRFEKALVAHVPLSHLEGLETTQLFYLRVVVKTAMELGH
jgi:hypothetical protein